MLSKAQTTAPARMDRHAALAMTGWTLAMTGWAVAMTGWARTMTGNGWTP